jgi:hypothetical protein
LLLGSKSRQTSGLRFSGSPRINHNPTKYHYQQEAPRDLIITLASFCEGQLMEGKVIFVSFPFFPPGANEKKKTEKQQNSKSSPASPLPRWEER